MSGTSNVDDPPLKFPPTSSLQQSQHSFYPEQKKSCSTMVGLETNDPEYKDDIGPDCTVCASKQAIIEQQKEEIRLLNNKSKIDAIFIDTLHDSEPAVAELQAKINVLSTENSKLTDKNLNQQMAMDRQKVNSRSKHSAQKGKEKLLRFEPRRAQDYARSLERVIAEKDETIEQLNHKLDDLKRGSSSLVSYEPDDGFDDQMPDFDENLELGLDKEERSAITEEEAPRDAPTLTLTLRSKQVERNWLARLLHGYPSEDTITVEDIRLATQLPDVSSWLLSSHFPGNIFPSR